MDTVRSGTNPSSIIRSSSAGTSIPSPPPDEDFVGVTVHGLLITDKEEAGKAILTIYKEATHGTVAGYRSISRSEYECSV